MRPATLDVAGWPQPFPENCAGRGRGANRRYWRPLVGRGMQACRGSNSAVVLRVDADFATALIDSHTARIPRPSNEVRVCAQRLHN